MGYDNNGYTKHDLVYASAESRPDNAPALTGEGTEVQIISENDNATHLVSEFVKSAPAGTTWGLMLKDVAGNTLKTILSGQSGLPGENDYVYFDIETDYLDVIANGFAGGELTLPPVITGFDADLESSEDDAGKTKKVRIRMKGVDCFNAATTQNRTTDNTSEPANTYPIVVDAGEFIAADGGFTWEASLDQVTWGESVTITTQPANDEFGQTTNAIPVYLRALLPCPVDVVTQYFVRQDPS
jgi:hypothetical protein